MRFQQQKSVLQSILQQALLSKKNYIQARRDFMLPPRGSWELRSSGSLRSA